MSATGPDPRGRSRPLAPPVSSQRAVPAADWRDRWLAWRDRLLASPRFQRWAARFPLTRPLARRSARALFDLCAGFVYTQVLTACVQLRVFDLLAEHPRSALEVAGRVRLPRPSAERLLDAAVALRLLEDRGGGRYGLGVLGAALRANPGVLAMVEHHALLYADLADPVALLRGERPDTALAGYWAYAQTADPAALPAARIAAYTTLMGASNALVADDILDAYPFARHRLLLDVGGGDGSFLIRVADRLPGLALRLFDLPAVAERAQARFAAHGFGTRVQAVGGSFMTDALPPGADLVTLVRIVHDHDDATVAHLLRAVHAALAPGGTVLIAEPMSKTPGAEPMGDAYFGLYLLAMGRGQPRSAARLAQLLAEAGFDAIRTYPTAQPLQTQVLAGRKVV